MNESNTNYQSFASNASERAYHNNREKLALQVEQKENNKRKVDQSWNEFNRLQQDSLMQYNKKLKVRFAPETESITIREWIQTLPKPDVFKILKLYLSGLIKVIEQKSFLGNVVLFPLDITECILITVDSLNLQEWQQVEMQTHEVKQKLFHKGFYSSKLTEWQLGSVYRQFPILEKMFHRHQTNQTYSQRYQLYCELICQDISLNTASTLLNIIDKKSVACEQVFEQVSLEIKNQNTCEKLIYTALLLFFEASLSYTNKINTSQAIQVLQAVSIITSNVSSLSSRLLAVFEFIVEDINLQPILHKSRSKANRLNFRCGTVRLKDILIVQLNVNHDSEKRYYSWAELCTSNLRLMIDPKYTKTIKIGKTYPLMYKFESKSRYHPLVGLVVALNSNSKIPTRNDPMAHIYLHSFFGQLITNYASSAFRLRTHNTDILLRFVPPNTSLRALVEYFVNLFDSNQLKLFPPYWDPSRLFCDIVLNLIWWIHQYLVSMYNSYKDNQPMHLAEYCDSSHDCAEIILGLLSVLPHSSDYWQRVYAQYSQQFGDELIYQFDEFLVLQYEWCNAILNYAYIHRFDMAAQCSLSLNLFLPKTLCSLVITYL